MSLNVPPPSWLALKAALHKRMGYGPPKIKMHGSYSPAGPDADGWQRHLLYFIYPITGNGVWQRNLDQLKQRLPLFNGQRWVAIASPTKRRDPKTGELHKCDPAREVVNYLGGDQANYIIAPHPARKLGEVLTFTKLWEQLQGYNGPRDVTFYAHAKGVTKPVHPHVSVHRWADLMYAANLDYWPDVARLLKTYCMVGAFKKKGWMEGDTRLTAFHYHGAFFWSRNVDVFARNWKAVRHCYGGSEMWPGQMFQEHEAACIFYGGLDVNMYCPWEASRAETALRHWPWPDKHSADPKMVASMRAFMETLG